MKTHTTFLFPFLNYSLRPFINNPEFADVIIRFRPKRTSISVSNETQPEEGEETLFYAHQAVLASRSSYFRKALSSITEEGNDTLPECLIEEEVTPQFFLELLKYIYTGEHIPS